MVVGPKHVVAITTEEEKRNCCVDGNIPALLPVCSQFAHHITRVRTRVLAVERCQVNPWAVERPANRFWHHEEKKRRMDRLQLTTRATPLMIDTCLVNWPSYRLRRSWKPFPISAEDRAAITGRSRSIPAAWFVVLRNWTPIRQRSGFSAQPSAGSVDATNSVTDPTAKEFADEGFPLTTHTNVAL
jgi:hypothetical protein